MEALLVLFFFYRFINDIHSKKMHSRKITVQIKTKYLVGKVTKLQVNASVIINASMISIADVSAKYTQFFSN